MKNVFRMLMIGFGVGLITLGFIGIALSNQMKVQRKRDWVLVGQRAGMSVASFTMNLSIGEHNLQVWLWVHNSTDAFYVVSDINKNQIDILILATTKQPSEWKHSDTYFQITNPGCYIFELFNATFSSLYSTAKIFQCIYVDECLYPYRSFLWVGIFSLVVGVPLLVVGFATPKN